MPTLAHHSPAPPAVASAIVALVAGVVLAGCGSTSEDDGAAAPVRTIVGKAQVAADVKAKLTAKVGKAPDDVVCPADLAAEVGATMTCVLKDGAALLDVALDVTSVEGGKVDYHMEVLPQKQQ